MKNLIICLIILLSFNLIHSQSYETLSKVKIPKRANIIKVVKVKNCEVEIEPGYTVKTEFEKKSGDKKLTFTKYDTLEEKKKYQFDKEINIPIKNFEGYATIFIDEKDKSKLIVNYWLNKIHEIKKDTKIEIESRTLKCPNGKNVVDSDYDVKKVTKQLSKDTKFRLWKVDYDPNGNNYENEDWFKHTDTIVRVYKNDEIDFLLVNKYDRNSKYEIKLNNREFISYTKKSVEFGPLTIPFKYRFGFTKDTVEVKQQFDSDLNIGFFAGYRLGKYRVRYEGKKFKQLPNISVTLGGFLNLSAVSLDKSSTTAGKFPYTDDEKSTIGILSPGVGVMLDIYNINLGAFLGIDSGFGTEAKNWNFNNKSWLGLGIAYNVNNFWKE